MFTVSIWIKERGEQSHGCLGHRLWRCWWACSFPFWIVHVKRALGDHANNLVELAERKIKKALTFSKIAKEEIATMCAKAKMIYEKALVALESENEEVVKAVRKTEIDIDRLQRVFESNHIRRIENKICNPLMGIVFVDILRNLECIGDHSTNIANAVLLGF